VPVHELVDIGANLTSKAFRADLDQVLARARAAGVGQIVVTGTSAALSAEAADLAAARGLYATAGIHPHVAEQSTAADHQAVRDLLAHPRVMAVGECGLDYNRNFSPPASQIACFEVQLALAAETGKPVFLHERDAADAFLAILRDHRPRLARAVVHCFTGDRRTLEQYLAMDLHIGITGWICDERRGAGLRDLVALVPRDRLMLETDAPYLLPRDLPSPPRDRRNEPAFLPRVLAAVAAAQGRTPEQVAAETTATARAFFGLPVDGAVSSPARRNERGC
jgi:TatD DNase family protein